MMHDQPRAVDLSEASGPTQPESDLLPSVQGSAYPVEAVAECHVIAHRDGQVVNFIVDRTLERREHRFPNFPECICSYVAQRGHDVERHDLPRIEGHDPIDVPRANRRDPPLYGSFDFGFLVFLDFFDCHGFLPCRTWLIGASRTVKLIQHEQRTVSPSVFQVGTADLRYHVSAIYMAAAFCVQ